MPVVKLPDGSRRDVPDHSTVQQVAESIGRGLAKAAVVGKVDGKLVDLTARIPQGEHELQIITDNYRGAPYPKTNRIKACKLLIVAGEYWRVHSDREQLTRIYATAFFDRKELEQYTRMLEEAKKRDHRILGPQLGLFTIDDSV